MQAVLRLCAAAVAMSLSVSAPASAQETHVVRLIADGRKDEYRFEPADLTVRPDDVVVFRVAGGAPHSIVFERAGLSPDVRAAFNAAMPGRSAELSSPLLTATGREYRIVVPRVPPGKYGYYCLPHRAYDMRGSLTIR
jgi:plastocyanin